MNDPFKDNEKSRSWATTTMLIAAGVITVASIAHAINLSNKNEMLNNQANEFATQNRQLILERDSLQIVLDKLPITDSIRNTK